MPRHPPHLPAEKLKLNSVCFLAETFGALFILKILSYYTELKFSPRAKRNFLHPYKPPFQRQICRLNPLLVGWSNVIFIFFRVFQFPVSSPPRKQTQREHIISLSSELTGCCGPSPPWSLPQVFTILDGNY